MRPKYIEVPIAHERSFRVTDEVVPYFYNPLHYHRELELTYVLQGTGMRFVGDSLEPFRPGELILVGSNLPHCWHNSPEYYHEGSSLRAQAIVVQFDQQFAGVSLLDIPELRPLKHLVQMAARGIKFDRQSIQKVLPALLRLVDVTGVQSITLLLDILETLAQSRHKQLLSSMELEQVSQQNMERLTAVIQFTIKNFEGRISLEEVAEKAHLSPTAFCRYFKAHTRKTFTAFVKEIRIKHACIMLRETDMNIADIGYRNGFSNQVHFFRTFKSIQGISPLQYRRMFDMTTF